jgi:hypothetical protein
MTEYRPLTDAELAEIRQRAESATPGPWTVYERQIAEFLVERGIGTEWVDPEIHWSAPIVTATQAGSGVAIWIEPENAEYIAKARTDMPRLVTTLDAFAHQAIYQALASYYKRGLYTAEEGEALERAVEVCRNLLKSRDDL